MTIYELTVDDTIPLSLWLQRGDGSFDTGRQVYVRAVNVRTGAELLAPTLMTETAQAGLYTYLWTHGLTVKTDVAVLYSVGAALARDSVAEHILFTDNVSRDDQSDGRAI